MTLTLQTSADSDIEFIVIGHAAVEGSEVVESEAARMSEEALYGAQVLLAGGKRYCLVQAKDEVCMR